MTFRVNGSVHNVRLTLLYSFLFILRKDVNLKFLRVAINYYKLILTFHEWNPTKVAAAMTALLSVALQQQEWGYL